MTSILLFAGLMVAFVCAGILCYARGYKAGVRYCVKHLGPLEEAARELAEMVPKK